MTRPVDKPPSLTVDWNPPLYSVEAIIGNRTVGSLVTVIQSEGEVLLSDIKVEKEIAPTDVASSWRPRWLRPKPSMVSFRGQRIGTLMLEHFLGWCREMKIAEAFGSVVQKDMEESPWLLDWYQRHGFEVRPPDERCLRNAVRMVVWTRDAAPPPAAGLRKVT